MERRRPAFLKRAVANEDRRRSQIGGESAAQGAAFRWAAVCVAFVLAIAVMVGFTDYGGPLARWFGAGLAWADYPAVVGLSWGDIAVFALVALVAAGFLWRDARRVRRAARDAEDGR